MAILNEGSLLLREALSFAIPFLWKWVEVSFYTKNSEQIFIHTSRETERGLTEEENFLFHHKIERQENPSSISSQLLEGKANLSSLFRYFDQPFYALLCSAGFPNFFSPNNPAGKKGERKREKLKNGEKLSCWKKSNLILFWNLQEKFLQGGWNGGNVVWRKKEIDQKN